MLQLYSKSLELPQQIRLHLSTPSPAVDPSTVEPTREPRDGTVLSVPSAEVQHLSLPRVTHGRIAACM